MKAVKMALALALAAVSTVVAPTSVSASVNPSDALYYCEPIGIAVIDGEVYDVYWCTRIA